MHVILLTFVTSLVNSRDHLKEEERGYSRTHSLPLGDGKGERGNNVHTHTHTHTKYCVHARFSSNGDVLLSQ